MARGSGRGNFGPLFQNPQLTCLTELTSQLGSQTGSRSLNGSSQWAWQLSPAVPGAALLAAVLEAAVDALARPVGAAVLDPAAYGVYPLIILIVYVLVTGGILCSGQSDVYLTTGHYHSTLTASERAHT